MPTPRTTRKEARCLTDPSNKPADALLDWLDRRRWWLLGGLALFYVAGFSVNWRPGSDSALYLVLARHLAQGEGYSFAGQTHTLVHPMLPWLLAGLWSIVGESVAAANALMLLLLAGGLALWFRALRLRFDRPRAVGITLLIAVAENVFSYGFQVLTDPVFFIGVAAVVAGYEGMRQPDAGRRRLVGELALLAVGMFVVIAARPFMWAMVAAVGLVGLWHLAAGPRRAAHGAMLGLTGLALLGFHLLDPRRGAAGAEGGYEAGVTRRLGDVGGLVDHVLTESLPVWLDPHATEAMLGVELGGPLNWLVGAAVFGLGAAAFRWRALWGWLFLFTAGVMLLYTPVVRYFMPLIPILAVGWFLLAERLLRCRGPYAHWAAAALLVLWVGPNVGRSIGFILDQRGTPYYAHQSGGRYEPIIAIADRQREALPAEAVIIGAHARELAWYFDRAAVEVERLAGNKHEPLLSRFVEAGRPLFLLQPVSDAAIAELNARGLIVGEPIDAAPPMSLDRLRRIASDSDTLSP